jgi:hypothetical protein
MILVYRSKWSIILIVYLEILVNHKDITISKCFPFYIADTIVVKIFDSTRQN